MRFERMTYGLEGSCSIQLSYECITGSGWEDFLFSSRFLLCWAERVCWTKWSVAERGECKPRGRGLGQRDIKYVLCFYDGYLWIYLSLFLYFVKSMLV